MTLTSGAGVTYTVADLRLTLLDSARQLTTYSLINSVDELNDVNNEVTRAIITAPDDTTAASLTFTLTDGRVYEESIPVRIQ